MLSIIPTPIGNLDDITLRAIKLFQSLEHIICENTNTTKKLMQHYGIEYKTKTFYKFTSHDTASIDKLLDICKKYDVGLVSECGTPCLSDPGKLIVAGCQEKNIPYSVLPGANALVPAVVAANFQSIAWTFLGFLPLKKGRETAIKTIMQSEYPVFVYESVHRMEKLCDQLISLGFVGKISIARELSKMYEQYWCDDIHATHQAIKNGTIPLKGEFVVGLWADKK